MGGGACRKKYIIEKPQPELASILSYSPADSTDMQEGLYLTYDIMGPLQTLLCRPELLIWSAGWPLVLQYWPGS